MMFNKDRRYISEEVSRKLPRDLIIILWNMIDDVTLELDYLQTFEITATKRHIKILHMQDRPQYSHTQYLESKFKLPTYLKVLVIDDGNHATMIIAD